MKTSYYIIALLGILGIAVMPKPDWQPNSEFTYINQCWGRSSAITTTGQSFQLSPLGASDSKMIIPFDGEIVAMSINCRTAPNTNDLWVTMSIGGSLKTSDTLILPITRTEASLDSLRFGFVADQILYPQTIQASGAGGADDCMLCIYARINKSNIEYDQEE